MLRYNLSPYHARIPYSIESYEPVDLLPEEQKQNNHFLKLAFTSKTANKNNFHIPQIQNIQSISNYNILDSVTKKLFEDKPLTENNRENLYNKYNQKNLYSFGNLANKSPKPVLSPAIMNNHNPHLISNKFLNPELNKNSINYVNNHNIPIAKDIHNIPRIQNSPQLMNRSKSSKFLSPIKHPQIIHKNNLNFNQILLPIKIRQLSPHNIVVKNAPSSPKKIIPIYRKIIYHRKKY